jgi:Domain of unknown function (DUF4437)
MEGCMRPKLTANTVLVLAVLSVGATADTPGGHKIIANPSDIAWGVPPPVLSPGAKFAVIDGNPAGNGNVTVRLIMPAGYKIAPHWHPTDEHVTVLAGTVSLGMGDAIDEAHALTLKTGGYAVASANMHHYAYTKTGATIQIHMMGPFQITYVNPQDDPSKNTNK